MLFHVILLGGQPWEKWAGCWSLQREAPFSDLCLSCSPSWASPRGHSAPPGIPLCWPHFAMLFLLCRGHFSALTCPKGSSDPTVPILLLTARCSFLQDHIHRSPKVSPRSQRTGLKFCRTPDGKEPGQQRAFQPNFHPQKVILLTQNIYHHHFYLTCLPARGQSPSLVPSSMPQTVQTRSLHRSQAPALLEWGWSPGTAELQAADPRKRGQQLSPLSANQTLKGQATNPVNTATVLTSWHIACVISTKNTALCAQRSPEKNPKSYLFKPCSTWHRKLVTLNISVFCNKDVTVSLNRKTKHGQLGITRQNKGLVKKTGRFTAFPMSLILLIYG